MTISIYMETIAYKYGGAEAYTAGLLEILQELYPDAAFRLITERLCGRRKLRCKEVVLMQNSAYGTHINEKNLSIAYFNFRKIDDRKFCSRLERLLKILMKELYEAWRFRSIMRLSEGSDLFINASFNLVGGKGKKNACIVHFPQQPLPLTGIKAKLPFIRDFLRVRNFTYGNSYDIYLPNSCFTAGWLKNYWHEASEKIRVLYPPVKTAYVSCERNPFQIVVCGRICPDKKADVLIKAYLSSRILRKKCHLVIAGSAIGEDIEFVREVEKFSPDVTVLLDPDRNELCRLFSSSGIFWHARGLGTVLPVDSEHFGMTTVEAMSAGCIPVVINKGGQMEIVNDECGFKWNTVEDLVRMTELLVTNPENAEALRSACIDRSMKFGTEVFGNTLKGVLSELLAG